MGDEGVADEDDVEDEDVSDQYPKAAITAMTSSPATRTTGTRRMVARAGVR
jgi:hypothetical protein